MEIELIDLLQKIVQQVDDGPNFCIGRESTGNLVWKGSFLNSIKMLRDHVAALQRKEEEKSKILNDPIYHPKFKRNIKEKVKETIIGALLTALFVFVILLIYVGIAWLLIG